MPPLQQICGVLPLLLSPRLLNLVNAILARAQTFKNLSLAESLLVSEGGLMLQTFEAERLIPHASPELLELLTKQPGKLYLGCAQPGGQYPGVGNRRRGQKSVKLRDPLLGPRDL